MMIKELFIGMVLLVFMQTILDKPELPKVQAESNKTIVEASQKPETPKVVKSAKEKKKPVSKPPVQPQVVSQPAAPARPTAVPVTGTCAEWMSAAGISDPANAAIIFQKESNCNPLASNPSSAAHGVCQSLPASKMASAGSDYMTNPITQMRWCESYAISRYGSWAKAVQFWYANKWW